MKNVFISITMVISAMSFTTFGKSLEQDKRVSVERDIRVMSNILATSISSQLGQKVKVRGGYLYDQGLLFTIKMQGGWQFERHFSFNNLQELTQLAEVSDVTELEQIEMDIEFDETENLRDVSIALRESERALREIEREVRDMERQERDIEFQNDLVKDKQNKEIEVLKQRKATLQAKQEKVKKEVHDKANRLKQKVQQRAQKKQQVKAEVVKTVGQSVCDFGAGLRSVMENDKVNIRIVEQQDQYIIFTKRSIDRCSRGDIDANSLLNDAIQYAM